MPTILDTTVINQAYDTSGNGGRKLVTLSNGWLVTALINGTTSIVFRVSKDGGSNWNQLCFIEGRHTNISISVVGTKVYANYLDLGGASIYFSYFDASTVSNVAVTRQSPFTVESSAGGGISNVINDTGTELHATWASKNATYPNSFNIRYAKGTINADGSVAWGAVEQVTKFNSATFVPSNPTLILTKNGKPSILVAMQDGSYYNILNLTKEFTTQTPYNSAYVDISWGNNYVYAPVTYTQSSPSAIFVPQEIAIKNPLFANATQGVHVVAWQGKDITNQAVDNIRWSYSLDGGLTWSAMQSLTNQNGIGYWQPSVTANKDGKLFILFHNAATGGIRKMVHTGSWGSLISVTTGVDLHASTLYDTTLNFTEPLFIYKGASKVGFYGTWTVTTISVTQGSIGTKSDKSNLLTYAITTDGAMSTITEKVNGVTVGTRSLTSGQSQIIGLSQAQWDAIKFGKYKDVTGGLNTLTIEMGSEKWTYTFDKRLATDADILSAVKATQDVQTTYLPVVKSKLASAVRGKGGTVNDEDSFEAMVSAVGGIPLGKKFSPITTTASATGVIAVTGLPFKPNYILGYSTDNTRFMSFNVDYSATTFVLSILGSSGSATVSITVNNDGFTTTANANYNNKTFNLIAFG